MSEAKKSVVRPKIIRLSKLISSKKLKEDTTEYQNQIEKFTHGKEE